MSDEEEEVVIIEESTGHVVILTNLEWQGQQVSECWYGFASTLSFVSYMMLMLGAFTMFDTTPFNPHVKLKDAEMAVNVTVTVYNASVGVCNSFFDAMWFIWVYTCMPFQS